MNEIINIPVEQLHPNPDNPRKDVGDVTELAESIKAVGVLQNLTVVPMEGSLQKYGVQHYTVLGGHRRLAAAQMAELESLPCIVTEMSLADQIGVMMTENMQRSDLTAREQGFGFQRMLDLGDTVDQIVSKTGVKKKRVRVTLGIPSLDQGKLAAAEERCGGQLSFATYEKLDRIEDVKERDRLLDAAGTNNFDYRYQNVLTKQEVGKALPGLKKKIRELGAKKIERSDTWNIKYKKVGRQITITKWTEQASMFPEKQENLFYFLNEDSDYVEFYRTEKQERQQRPKEEIEREKAIAQAHEDVKNLSKTAFETRVAFVKELRVTKENRDQMIRAFVILCLTDVIAWHRTEKKYLAERLGLEKGETYDAEKALVKFDRIGEAAWPMLIYSAFGDGENVGYNGGYRYAWPEHKQDPQLDHLYDWLTSVGYQMSDTEIQLQDGSHEVFHRGDAE